MDITKALEYKASYTLVCSSVMAPDSWGHFNDLAFSVYLDPGIYFLVFTCPW